MFKTREECKEKHLPEIKIGKVNDIYEISIEVGKEIKHPNNFEHNISWIDIYVEVNKNIIHVARVDLKAHGEENVFTEPKAKIYIKAEKIDKVIAVSYCNRHGLWKNEISLS